MMFANMAQDLRYGFRTMLKNPLFTLIATLAIAIGIGANVLVFSLVERVLLSPLPYPEPLLRSRSGILKHGGRSDRDG
jgi:hypothetical protein